MGNGSDIGVDCSGGLCSFGIYGSRAAGCSSGNGSCREAFLLEAEVSGFHTAALQEATLQINEILQGLYNNDTDRIEGSKLSFLITNMGCLIAWVEHGAIVTENDDDDTIAEALRLKGRCAAQSAQQAL